MNLSQKEENMANLNYNQLGAIKINNNNITINYYVLAAPFNPLKSEFQSKTKFVLNSM